MRNADALDLLKAVAQIDFFAELIDVLGGEGASGELGVELLGLRFAFEFLSSVLVDVGHLLEGGDIDEPAAGGALNQAAGHLGGEGEFVLLADAVKLDHASAKVQGISRLRL